MKSRISAILDLVLSRLSESSTWRGIVLGLTACGIVLDPEKVAAITAAGLAVVAAINIFRQGAPTKSQVADALAAKQDKPPTP